MPKMFFELFEKNQSGKVVNLPLSQIRVSRFQPRVRFDEKALEEGIPDQEQPFGIDKVFINGSLVYSDNQLDEQALKTSGRAIPVLG